MKSASNDVPFSIRLLVIVAGILWIPSLILPPEGGVRNGDSLPIVLPWLILLAAVLFVRGLIPGLTKKENAKRIPLQKKDQNKKGGEKESAEKSAQDLSFVRRVVWPDLLAASLLIWTGISWGALSLTHSGNPLYAANMFWTFALMIVVYFVIRLLRPFGRQPLEAILLAGLLGAALFETGLALYSYGVTDPAMREAFRRDPEKLLRESGLDWEMGSPEYLLMEKRVLTSSEPIGSYGMANTLAGFLVPVLILLTGSLFAQCALLLGKGVQKTKDLSSNHSSPNPFGLPGRLRRPFGRSVPSRWKISVLVTVSYLLPIWSVLILTKSRAGYLAFFAGTIGTLAAFYWGRPAESEFAAIDSSSDKEKKRNLPDASSGRKRGIKLLAGAVSVFLFFALCLGGAFRLGFLDAEVFSEAKKSLGYRLDYWDAASRMIADHPFFGVGPGNFQTIYPHYILPTAGETIADPHHFVFELASVFGIPAAIFFLAFIISLIPAAFGKRSESEAPPLKIMSALPLFLGGFLLYAILNFLTSAPTGGNFLTLFFLPLLIAAVPTAGMALNPRSISSPLILVTLGAILLNLCAAGGIAFPAVALPIWGLAGILVNRRLTNRAIDADPTLPVRRANRLPYYIGAGMIAAAILAFYFTAFSPHRTETSLPAPPPGETPAAAYSRLEMNARGAGRHSIPIHQELYFSALAAYAQTPTKTDEERWRRAKENLFAVAPNSSAVRSGVGRAEIDFYERTRRLEFLDAAIESFAEASRFFPTDAAVHARLGLALYDAHRTEEAIPELTEAFRLDEITPHEDRKIPDSLRQRMKGILP